MMLVSLELPEQLVSALQFRASETHSSLEDVAVEAIERDLAGIEPTGHGHRVHFPVIRSAQPGTLKSLTNAEIDDISG